MKNSKIQEWNQEAAFPIIAHAIEVLGRPGEKFISVRDIVPFLLRDTHTRSLIQRAHHRKGGKQSMEAYTANMVQWFSQRWTVGDQKWLSLFGTLERSDNQVAGCWAYRALASGAVGIYPDEVQEVDIEALPEGAVFKRLINAYERNPLARQLCIKKYGCNCFVCGFSFGRFYGQVVEGFIHVHHLRQLSKVGGEYKVDPIVDLRPVCPNCHAVLHRRRGEPYAIEDVQALLRNGACRGSTR